jgi:membrane-bound lytic murein transglycosylase A
MRLTWALVAAAGLVLAACATTPPPSTSGPVATTRPHTPHGAPPPGLTPAPPLEMPRLSALQRLPGWFDEDHRAALEAFQAGCAAARDPAMRGVCGRARSLRGADEPTARRFFEDNFRVAEVGDGPAAEGVLTAYFAPEYPARTEPDAEFSAPVRPRPTRTIEMAAYGDDPIDAVLARRSRLDLATVDRSTIDKAPADGALAWMKPEDLFFLQIQGSGVLTFPDGRRMKAAYAADNGLPFVAIARPMVERGIFKPNGASGDSIRGWLAANRGQRAQAVMQLNPRYIFFDLTADDGREPAGAAGVPLPAGRAIAVDPSRHAYGDLYWIDAEAPVLAGAHKVYRRLAMALDTGSAIRGQVRADLYVGRGEAAGREAGRVRHTLKMVRLKPIDPARSARHETDDPARGG